MAGNNLCVVLPDQKRLVLVSLIVKQVLQKWILETILLDYHDERWQGSGFQGSKD
jgi:hypothetical protein